MSHFLDTIHPLVIQRVCDMQSVNAIETPAVGADFLDIFKQKKPVIIAEIKFASPSRGIIYNGDMDPVAIAGSYLKNGASALSVLAEPEYFKGDIQYIRDIRNAYPNANILLKDFVLDKKQIIQAKQYGANAVLLIVAFLKPNQLEQLYHFAVELNLTPLIEVHDLSELQSVLPLNPKLIGINNRNLQSLKIDLATSRNLINQIPDAAYAICESGIDSPEQIQEMHALGFDGFLVGTSFMKTPDPGIALNKMLHDFKDEN